MDRVPSTYAAADASVGFQARSIRDLATWKHSWGDVVVPKCYPKLENLEQDWTEGAERLDHLHEHGSTAFAFNFAKPFDAAGNPCPLDHVAMQVKGKANAAARG